MSEGLKLRTAFDGSDLPLLRSPVGKATLRTGLGPPAQGMFVQAALEIETDAVAHGGGAGTAELPVAGGELHRAVTDSGPGPARRQGRGWGGAQGVACVSPSR